MASDLKDAGSAPRQLLWRPSFWVAQKSFLAATLLTLAAAYGVGRLPTLGGLDKLPLSAPMLIHLIAFWALLVAARALAETRVEHAIALVVGSRAATDLGKVEAGQMERVDLSRIEADYLPNNPNAELGILRLFQQIILEAKDRRFNSSFELMQPFKEGAFLRLAHLETLQRIALHLGILGTFLGLVYAIAQLELKDGTLAVGQIQPLLGALSLSFGTSIAGIEVAILTRLLSSVVVRKQERYFDSMEEATVFLTSLTRNAINKDEYIAELGAVQVAMRQLGDRILDQTQGIGRQTGAIQSGMESLIEAKKGLDSFLADLAETQGGFVEEMREVYSVLSPESLARQFKEAFAESSKALDDEFRSRLDRALDGLRAGLAPLQGFEKSLDKIRQVVDSERDGFRTANETFLEGRKDQESQIAYLVKRQDEWVERLEKSLPADLAIQLREVVDGLGVTITAAVLQKGSEEVVQAIQGAATKARGGSQEVLAKLAEVKSEVARLRTSGVRAVVVFWPLSWIRDFGLWCRRLVAHVTGWSRPGPKMRERIVKLERRDRS